MLIKKKSHPTLNPLANQLNKHKKEKFTLQWDPWTTNPLKLNNPSIKIPPFQIFSSTKQKKQ